MSRTLQQIFTDNPITTNQGADLMYFARSPYSPGNDAGMLFSDFKAQFGSPFTPSALTKTNDTNVTLTLGGTPATSLLQAVSLTLGWTGQLSPARGGTGVNNGSNTLTLGGSLTTSGAFNSTFTMTGATNVTFPTSGTLATTSQIPSVTPSALTGVNDTNVTLSLGGTPATSLLQSVSITLGWTGTLSPARGGTGVNNGTSTITIGGNFSMVGAFTFAGTLTGNTAVTFPTSGTLATTSQIPSVTPSALTSSNDTNVTITLGGTPATSLLQSVSLTLGWTGILAVGRGGTGVNSVTIAPTATAFSGWDANKNLSANNFIPGYATTVSSSSPIVLTVSSAYQQYITGSTAQTFTLPVTSTLATVASGTAQSYLIVNDSSATATVNSSGGNLVESLPAGSQATFTCISNSGTTAASWASDFVLNVAGVSSITGTANQVIASSSTGAVTLSLPQSIATSSAVTFASVQFSGNNGLLDSNGKEILAIAPGGASAVNYLTLGNAISGASPSWQATGTDANIGMTFQAKAAATIAFTSSTLANYMVISPSATTVPVTISAQGSDSNVGLNIESKATGQITLMSTNASPLVIESGTTLQHTTTFAIPNTANSRTVTLPDVSFTVSTAVISTQIFTSGSGTYTPTSGAQYVWVRAIAGGGQGAGATSGTATTGVGGGGGAGGYGEFWEAATSRAYSVGAGGTTGTAGNPGQAGGNTTFGTAGAQLSLVGGSGGVATNGASPSAIAAGGAGGAATTATLGVAGGHGGSGATNTTFVGVGGFGANSPLGAGGIGGFASTNTSVAGTAGQGNGSGGGGGICSGTSGSAVGGAGASGIIIIVEYA